VLLPGRDGIHFDPTFLGDEHQLVKLAGTSLPQIHGGVGRDDLMQHRLVIETRDDGDRRRVLDRQAVQLDRKDRAEGRQRVERLLHVH